MKIVVDTNIIFSAVLNSSSNIGKILINFGRHFEFYSCDFLVEEIQSHRKKLKKLSGLNDFQLDESVRLTTANIHFINEDLLPKKDWIFAANILSRYDQKDIPFVALNNNLKAHLWTGDKKLLKGLEKEGYNKTVTTSVILDKLKFK